MMVPDSNIICPNCNSDQQYPYAAATDIEYFTSAKTYQYYCCSECGVLFIFPQPINDLKLIYPENYYSFTSETGFAFKIKKWLDKFYFKNQLSKLDHTTIKVLDIGGGTGNNCDIVKSSDKRVIQTTIVDFNESASNIARQKGHNYYCSTIEDFETTEKYDLILMMNLLEHIASPVKVLKLAHTLLAPNGIIILQTPNYKSLDAAIFKNNSWGGYHCPRHWVIYNKTNFTALCKACGLRINSFSYIQGAAFWTVSILNFLQKRKLLVANNSKPLVYHPLFAPVSMLMAVFDFIRKPFVPLSQMLVVLKKAEN